MADGDPASGITNARFADGNAKRLDHMLDFQFAEMD